MVAATSINHDATQGLPRPVPTRASRTSQGKVTAMKSESRDARTLHEGRSLVYARVSDHHKKFIDEETGAFDEKYVRYRTCPVCDSRDHYQLLVKSGGTCVLSLIHISEPTR